MKLLQRLFLSVLLLGASTAFANDFYNHGGFPATGSPATSAAMRAELDAIDAGFDKLPTITGNASKALVINGGATAITVTTGTMSLAGNFSITGAFATTGAFGTTFVQGATTSLTLPVVNGTLATLAGTETLTNKTINLTSNTLTGTTAQFNTALSDNDFATLAGSESLSNKTIASPVLSGTTTGTYTLGGTPTVSVNLPITKSSDPRLILNTTSGSNRRSIVDFQLNGSSKYGLILDQSLLNTQEFTLYDYENSLVIWNSLADGSMSFPREVRFDGLLNLGAASGANRGQIKFPATDNPSADVNTLDDYEEGTWTPSIGGSATYTSQVGTYTKVGRQVTVSASLIINSLGTGSATTIQGLPFTAGGASNFFTGAVMFSGLSSSVVTVVARIPGNTATVVLLSASAAATGLSQTGIIGSGTTIQFTVTYWV